MQVVGWLFCLFNLAGMAGSEMAARLYLDRSRRGIFMAAITALGSVLMWAAGAGAGHVQIALAMFVLTNFCAGLVQPVQQSWFNEQIEGEYRATLLSFQTTFATFGAAAGLPTARQARGPFRDRRRLADGRDSLDAFGAVLLGAAPAIDRARVGGRARRLSNRPANLEKTVRKGRQNRKPGERSRQHNHRQYPTPHVNAGASWFEGGRWGASSPVAHSDADAGEARRP